MLYRTIQSWRPLVTQQEHWKQHITLNFILFININMKYIWCYSWNKWQGFPYHHSQLTRKYDKYTDQISNEVKTSTWECSSLGIYSMLLKSESLASLFSFLSDDTTMSESETKKIIEHVLYKQIIILIPQ